MELSRVTSNRLTEEHLNAHYYTPKFLRNEEILAQCGLPRQAIGAIAIKCNCGATPKNVEYDGHGQGLIRTTDVRPNQFLESGVLRTKALSVPSEGATAAITDDIVYTMSGTVGFAAVIPETSEVFSFSNTIARARLRKESKHDPRFVAAFFNSRYGYTQSIRLVSGGIQGHVMPNPFKRLLVPTPDTMAQKYIGDKVGQAERLKTHSTRLVAFAKTIVEALIDGRIKESEIPLSADSADLIADLNSNLHWDLSKRLATLDFRNGLNLSWQSQRRHNQVPVGLITDRIDAWYHRKDFLEIEAIVREGGECSRLGEMVDPDRGITGGATPLGANYLSDGRVRFYRTSDIKNGMVDPFVETFISKEQDEALIRSRLEEGDVLLSITGVDFGHSGIIASQHLPGNISQHSVRFRPTTVDPAYLVAYLESDYGQRIIWRQAYGAAV